MDSATRDTILDRLRGDSGSENKLEKILGLVGELSKDEKFNLAKILLKPNLILVRCHNCEFIATDDSDYVRYCDCGKYFCLDCYKGYLDRDSLCGDCSDQPEMC